MNIVLKKGGSGAWEQRRKSGILLSLSALAAWQRLWFVASVLYLLLIVASGYLLAPTRNQIDRAMILAVTEEVKKFDGLAFAGQAPSTIFAQAKRAGFSAWIQQVRRKFKVDHTGDAGLQAIDQKFRADLSSLPQHRLRVCVLLFLAWLVPMLLLYLMGYLLDWISRGRPLGRK